MFSSSAALRRGGSHCQAVWEREGSDVIEMERILGRKLDGMERQRVGVSQLRRFLEKLLRRRYLENVPSIVPVLEKEFRNAQDKLTQTVQELSDLDTDKLKERGTIRHMTRDAVYNTRCMMVHSLFSLPPDSPLPWGGLAGRNFYANFVAKIPLLIRGTMAAPVERFGETLADEHIRGGAFVNDSGRPLATSSTLSNADMRLLGGAQVRSVPADSLSKTLQCQRGCICVEVLMDPLVSQWTRALEEFRAILGGLVCAPVNKEEIVNACGVDEMHDGINYTRTACIIAVAKAKECFEPFLHQLGYRLMHVMRRLLQMAMYLMRKDGQFLNGHELFLKRVGSCYYSFVEENMRSCLAKCLEDLESTTEFVTYV